MKQARQAFRILTALALIALVVAGTPLIIAAQGEGEERGISFSGPYTGVQVTRGKTVNLYFKVLNTGSIVENLDFSVSGPEDWSPRAMIPGYTLRSMRLAPGEEEEMTFQATAPREAEAGDYTFLLQASSKDGQIEDSLEITISVAGGAALREAVELSTNFPVVRTPIGSKLEFKINLTNEGSEAQVFDLSAVAPTPQWEINFESPFEKKTITSVSVDSLKTEMLNVKATPPARIEPGSYTITVEARSGTISDSLDLTTVITGTFELELITGTGRLNTNATAGKETHLSLFVHNGGTAAAEDIAFVSQKPEGWTITFSPDRIASLEADEFREVDVTIKPVSTAIAGDYRVILGATAEQTVEELELRVSVFTATIWGWVGIGIVVVVIAGLVGTFVYLGRR